MPTRPNIVLIFCDDLGYGDVGCFGSNIPTPNIDRMAREGMRLTQFDSASPVCSPSRAAMLTGRYPTRTGVHRVLLPSDTFGLPQSEITIAEMLKPAGYRTMCVGKWHLGTQSDFYPTNHGFDEYYGLLYSNDMSPLKLVRNRQTMEDVRDQGELTARYTEEAISFIERAKDGPFFLYLPHSMPHMPAAASSRFLGKSGLGIYGDAVMELDWSVGRILDCLKANNLDNDTLVIFTSDNGPWYQGSAGKLQGRKGSTYEGGVREPFVARMPGRIPADKVCDGFASTLDLLPTLGKLCGADLPGNPIDGLDIWPMLTGQTDHIDREMLLYFDGWNIQCARFGPWKLHVARYNSFAWTLDPAGGRMNLPLPHDELYNLDEDPTEAYNVADEHKHVVANIRAKIESMLPTFPEQVRNAWRDTVRIPVQDTPVGALPRQETN